MKTFHRSTGRKLLTAVLISAVIIAVFVMLQLAAHTPQTTTTMEVYADYLYMHRFLTAFQHQILLSLEFLSTPEK